MTLKRVRVVPARMDQATLNPPERRECLRCGRVDVWDGEIGDWTISTEDGEKLFGNPFCLHEWDITGTHTPIKEER